MSLTMRERMMACYCQEAIDKPALGIYSRYLKRGNMERMARNGEMGIIDYVSLTSSISPPWHLMPEFISAVKDTDISVEYYWEKGVCKQRRKYATPVGTVYAEVGASKGDGSEHISHYYIQSPEDYRVMKYIVENIKITKNEEMFRKRQEDLGDDGVVLGRVDRTPYQKLLLELVGSEQFLMDLYDDEAEIEELMEAMYRRMDEEMECVMESSAQIIWMPENVTVDMTPPYMFEKYHLGAYQKYSKWAHQAGKTIIAHFDGKVKPLKDMLLQSGLDGLDSVSDVSVGGDATYEELCRMFPNMSFMPNFPANLATDTDGKLEEYVEWIKSVAERNKRSLMLQVSEDLPDTSYATAIPRIVAAMYKM